jgi:uncharacterized membrane protein
LAELTIVVSREAIFLSTFVMIAQNRQAKANRDFNTSEQELRENTNASDLPAFTTDERR